MFQGEIYAYPLYLQKHFAIPKQIGYFWQDVLCQYWPWLRRVDHDVADKLVPALSVMHAMGHAWYCEVIFRNEPLQQCCYISICCIYHNCSLYLEVNMETFAICFRLFGEVDGLTALD